jgi:hypothetical protein
VFEAKVPSGQLVIQDELRRYALSPPVKVQEEQVVAVKLQAMHLGSHVLHIYEPEGAYDPTGHAKSQTLLNR